MTPNQDVFSVYAFISLGANLNSTLGTPKQNIHYAIQEMAAFSSQPLLISSLLSTKPVDCPPNSPDYMNAVVGLVPEEIETPLSLLHRLQALENKVGRTRSGLLNEPRVLDLDLISFKNMNCDTEELILPHPRAHQRKFVLEPLLELVGDIYFHESELLISDLLVKMQ